MSDTGTDTLTKIEENLDLKEPSLYKVVFLNDDVTPMDFVMNCLMSIFNHSLTEAEELTHKIHQEGFAIVAVLPYEIAEQKGIETTVLSRNNNYPLQVKIEADN
jgi:ATP-dependent Clp protease adaptor protein ClpS